MLGLEKVKSIGVGHASSQCPFNPDINAKKIKTKNNNIKHSTIIHASGE
jgi:hypothetical protein